MVDKWQAQYNFWNQFGVPAYKDTDVPDSDWIAKNHGFPYITYQSAGGGFGELIPINASIWDRNTSWENADRLSDEIEHYIRTTTGYPYSGGMIRVYIGETNFSQDLGDPDDDLIKRKILSVVFEFMQLRI